MKVGTAAAVSGCHIEAIRYYVRVGRLPRPARTDGGHCDYQPTQVHRLRLATRGRELGCRLGEIRALLMLSDDPAMSCRGGDRPARHHLADIEQRVRATQW